MLHERLGVYSRKEFIYIPYGAEKGDCIYCKHGVLRREKQVEESFESREDYICAHCRAVFLEHSNRYFKRVAVWRGLYGQRCN